MRLNSGYFRGLWFLQHGANGVLQRLAAEKLVFHQIFAHLIHAGLHSEHGVNKLLAEALLVSIREVTSFT